MHAGGREEVSFGFLFAPVALRMHVLIESTDSIKLEAVYTPSVTSDTCCIITHPYGPLGGNLDNNVVSSLFSYFSESKNYTTIKFNFRGIGKSTGKTSYTGINFL